jgi:DNA-binding winged helix-turn-helix (wHTH) protein/dipeptidyl aminopeptidase/acylaminoacyl peptidase
MNELFVGDFRIDVKRSEVIYQKNISTLEPKVLKVLLLLAENPGEIIPRQQLLDEVWPDVIVEANTLQRCIAQLRKAFNDDAKKQAFITTHPRRGYSLVADVSWQEVSSKIPSQDKTENIKKTKRNLVTTFLFITTLLAVSLFWFSKGQSPAILNVKQITPLTATEATEYRASFSPSGKYVAFQRYVDVQTSHIWVKDLNDNSEYQLTSESAIYGKPEWSPDGTKIALHRSASKKGTVKSGACYAITSLSFTLAKGSPQAVRQLTSCEDEVITSLTWLSNHSLVYTLGNIKNNPVIEVNINKKTRRILYQNKNKISYELTFSARNNTLAFLQVGESEKNNIVLFNINSGDFKEIKLNFPKGYDNRHWSGFNWHPQQDRFLISNNQSLIEVTTDGEFIEYPMMTYQRIYDPVYHPSGNSIAATLGLANVDIEQLDWDNNDKLNVSADKKLFSTTVSEGSAKYRPQTESNTHVEQEVVFISNRSGSYQLWFDNGKQLKQWTHFAKGKRIGTSAWSLDGNLLALNVDNQVQLLNIEGKVEQVFDSSDFVNVYQWVNNNEILVRTIANDHSQIILFDVNTGKSTVLYQGQADWVQLDSQGNLYLSDVKGRVFKIVDGKKIQTLEIEEYSINRTFLLRADMLFFNDHEGGFWQFNLQTKELLLLAKRNARALRIDDVDLKNKRLLYLNYVQGRKEIVLFH